MESATKIDTVQNHYFETHIIVEIESLIGLDKDEAEARKNKIETAKVLARGNAYWYSVMGDDDSNEESFGDMVFTTRDKSLVRTRERMKDLADEFKKKGFKVKRMKIEAAIFDTKEGDVL